MRSRKLLLRELKKKDFSKLVRFLMGLDSDTFSFWNRFGFSLSEFNPEESALEVCSQDLNKEKGFVCLNSNEDMVAYSYLRLFPEKKTKKHNASLGIVVHPEYQGKGLGRKMMVFMHDWAKKNGISKIWLATYARNKKALHLYKKLGYQIEGIFMYDEFGKFGWDHVVSLALMLDDKFNKAKEERSKLISEIENEQ